MTAERDHDALPSEPAAPAVLAVDIGGSHVKMVLNGVQERRRFDSGPDLTPGDMASGVLGLMGDWSPVGISVGVPAMVSGGRVVHEPVNLGRGWVGFDFESAFGKPTKIVNDAAMQALGSYEGGRMLFLGLGTGLGSAMIVDGILEPMELGHLPFRKATYEDYVGLRGLERLGKKRWREAVNDTITTLVAALEPGVRDPRRRQRAAPPRAAAERPARQQRGCLPGRLPALGRRLPSVKIS